MPPPTLPLAGRTPPRAASLPPLVERARCNALAPAPAPDEKPEASTSSLAPTVGDADAERSRALLGGFLRRVSDLRAATWTVSCNGCNVSDLRAATWTARDAGDRRAFHERDTPLHERDTAVT